ncbi:MAG: flippase [Cyanobacteria bacterium J06639_16]
MQQSNVLATLVRGASTALVIQILSAGVLYGTQVLLARWLGTTAYGIYDYVNAVGVSLAFLAGLGLPVAVLRFTSEYVTRQDWARLRGIIWGSWQQTLVVSLITSICGTAIVLQLQASGHLSAYTTPLTVGIWAVPIVALLNLQTEIVRAFQQITLAYAPALILHPLLLIAMAFVWQLRQTMTSTAAIALTMISALLTLVLQWVLFQKNLDPKIRSARPVYAVAYWSKIALPLLLVSGSHIILSQTDTLMIGTLINAKAVGIYSAALKTSLWVPFILIAVNAISAPLIASLYAQGDRPGLQQLVSTVARWMFYPAFAIAVVLISFSKPILQLFGTEFAAAKVALIILILGQLVNVGVGSVAYLMMMTGHQNQSALVMGVSALTNVILNLIGIHFLGIIGAALATALSMTMWNVWLHALVVRELGVRPSILATFQLHHLQ